MNINWNIQHVDKLPYSVSYHVYGDVKRMIRNMDKNKKCYISVNLHTKTSLDITMHYDYDSFGVAHVPRGADKFTFVKNKSYSYFSGTWSERCYFRFSNRQNLKELKEYITLVLAEMNLKTDEIEVCMTIRGIEGLKE